MSGMHEKFSTKHHNPHAHVIHKPGKRLLKKVPLRFVWNKVSGHGRKATNSSPPNLAAKASSGSDDRIAAASLAITPSPTAWPNPSLTALK